MVQNYISLFGGKDFIGKRCAKLDERLKKHL